MLEQAQASVKEFHEKFNLPVATRPTLLQRERVELRSKWMQEEIKELLAATNVAEQADAVADLIYFALGIFVEMGVDGGRIFELVHSSNMTKLGSDGLPIYNQDGKVIKPSTWISPHEMIQQFLNEAK